MTAPRALIAAPHAGSLRPPPARAASARIGSLDGVRGAAAVLVMLWHIYLVMSPAVNAWVALNGSPALKSWWPPIDDGAATSAVVGVFFLLSGAVVSLPALREGFDWVAYYPARLLRLMLPVWAAVAFGVALIALIPRTSESASPWLRQISAETVQPTQVLRESFLLTQLPQIDSPLWSLSWEVLFSLFLAAYLFVAKRSRTWPLTLGLAVVLLALGDEVGIPALSCLPAFLIGAVAAVHWGRVTAAAHRIGASRRHALWWSLILTGSLVSILGGQVTHRFFTQKPLTIINHLLDDTTIVGYAGLLFLLIGSVHARRLLESRPMMQLGRLSFSLYLVHMPIVATVGFVVGTQFGLLPAISVPVSLLAAWGFARFVERPSNRIGKRAGAALSEWLRGARTSHPIPKHRQPALAGNGRSLQRK